MRKILLIFFLIILAGGVAFYFFFSRQEKAISDKERQAALEKLLGHHPVLSTDPKENIWGIHDGKYFSISYPITARIYSADDYSASPAGGILERFQFGQEDPRYYFTIQVLSADTAKNYDDVAGVRLRRLEKDIYTEKPLSISGISSLEFLKNGDNELERSVFVLANKKIYSFSITGTNPKLLTVFDRVVGSIKIKD